MDPFTYGRKRRPPSRHPPIARYNPAEHESVIDGHTSPNRNRDCGSRQHPHHGAQQDGGSRATGHYGERENRGERRPPSPYGRRNHNLGSKNRHSGYPLYDPQRSARAFSDPDHKVFTSSSSSLIFPQHTVPRTKAPEKLQLTSSREQDNVQKHRGVQRGPSSNHVDLIGNSGRPSPPTPPPILYREARGTKSSRCTYYSTEKTPHLKVIFDNPLMKGMEIRRGQDGARDFVRSKR